jgi:hypothetical protein
MILLLTGFLVGTAAVLTAQKACRVWWTRKWARMTDNERIDALARRWR